MVLDVDCAAVCPVLCLLELPAGAGEAAARGGKPEYRPGDGLHLLADLDGRLGRPLLARRRQVQQEERLRRRRRRHLLVHLRHHDGLAALQSLPAADEQVCAVLPRRPLVQRLRYVASLQTTAS